MRKEGDGIQRLFVTQPTSEVADVNHIRDTQIAMDFPKTIDDLRWITA